MHPIPERGPSRPRGRRAVIALGVFAILVLSLAVVATASARPLMSISDPSATPTWTLDINGSGASVDTAWAVVADGGGAFVAGAAGNAAGNQDATLARVSGGALKWFKRYDGPAHKGDGILKLAKGPGGVLYGAGWSQNALNKSDLLVVKWSPGGKRLWVKRYDGALHGDDLASAVGVDKNGNVTVAGISQSAAGGYDWVVVKWSAQGVKRWVWRRDGSAHGADAAMDLLVKSDGTTYVTGWIVVTGPPDKFAALTVKFSPAGKKVWSRTFLGSSSLGAAATSIASRPAGGVYIAGWTAPAPGTRDGLVMRYSAGGAGAALPAVTLPGNQSFSDVAVLKDRKILAVGTDNAPGNNDAHYRYFPNETGGSIPVSVGGGFDDGFTGVATDAFNGVYMTGYRRTAADQAQIWTWRGSGTPGGGTFMSLWGPALGPDAPASLAVSGTTAYVVGQTYTGPAEGQNQVILAYQY